MFNVYYTYEFVERKKEKKGFSCQRYLINDLIGTYETIEEAKKHPSFEKEKEFDKGNYIITKEELIEKIELPPKKIKPKEKTKKKKK